MKMILRVLVLLTIVLLCGQLPAKAQSYCEDVDPTDGLSEINIVRSNPNNPAVVTLHDGRPGDFLYIHGIICGPDKQRLRELEVEIWRYTTETEGGIQTSELYASDSKLTFQSAPWTIITEKTGVFDVVGVPSTGPDLRPTSIAFVVNWDRLPKDYKYVIFNFQKAELIRVQSNIASTSATQ